MTLTGIDGESGHTKPHAVCMPLPFQGHINAMQVLAKVLHHRGFHVTFVNTEFNNDRLRRTVPSAVDGGAADFRFESIPDGLPPSDPNASQDTPTLCKAFQTNFLAPFCQLLSRLDADAQFLKTPPVTCIVADGFLTFVYTAGAEFGIPVVAFWTFAACSLVGSIRFPSLKERGYFPLKDTSSLTNGYLDTGVDWISGKKKIRLRDLPTYLRSTDSNDFMFHFVLDGVQSAGKASASIINTFTELEPEELEVLSDVFPRLYPIGPIHMLLKHVPEGPTKSISFNLWREEPQCLEWLDSQAPGSVLYVNFGSMTIMTAEQLVEFAWGLAKSQRYFLWVIRSDLVNGKSAVLPPEFVEETRGRRWLAGWCPQEAVLQHPAVGGFLTHCGWNSTMETIAAGVPVICWPFIADQPTNCRYSCVEWGIGMELEGQVRREGVERLVRELMEGTEGRRLKTRVMKWKRLAQAATAPNGSSSVNLDKVIKDVVLKSF